MLEITPELFQLGTDELKTRLVEFDRFCREPDNAAYLALAQDWLARAQASGLSDDMLEIVIAYVQRVNGTHHCLPRCAELRRWLMQAQRRGI